ncbi:MAG TPA: biosynthetic arginine decarboxylase [Chlamydiales bacterium]|nr:biosynthetic arginine decarboxylase [Chlamydiales bacterium]
MKTKAASERKKGWSVAVSRHLYKLGGWGGPYFDCNGLGNVVVRPGGGEPEIDLYELVKSLVERGIDPPVVLRFDGIIRDRIQKIYGAFQGAIKESGYKGSYHLAYPIKVNQQKQIVDLICEAGKTKALGLEIGSKPELLAVLALQDFDGSLLLCNGYKDAEYIQMALLAQKIGRHPILILEQADELPLVLETAEKMGMEIEIGFRMKPHARGSGKWASSGGDRAKFGLNAFEIMQAIDKLKKVGKIHWVKLLHLHVGSQIPTLAAWKRILREAGRFYAEIAKLCPALTNLDIGGGLAVDYEGTQGTSDCSVNYSTEEYAKTAVLAIQEICDKEKLPHPTLISESGRSLVAYHSVLITEVMSVSQALDPIAHMTPIESNHPLLKKLAALYQNSGALDCQQLFHEAHNLKKSILEKFIEGEISLPERAYADQIFHLLMVKEHLLMKTLKELPEEVERFDRKLVDLYFCNFSIFKSLPDVWAIDQIFPVMPIHRLNEEPTQKGIIADLTCDSDGKIDRFFSSDKPEHSLPLHLPNKTPYYLGIFLVGAYQEILGGFHNLFGNTHAVHIDFDANGKWEIKAEILGDTMKEVLKRVQFDPEDLVERLRLSIEKALKEGRLNGEESAQLKKQFKEILDNYTYLVV